MSFITSQTLFRWHSASKSTEQKTTKMPTKLYANIFIRTRIIRFTMRTIEIYDFA